MSQQHREVVPVHGSHRVLAPGPISVAPEATELFTQAVKDGGGTLVDLGPETRGLIWLSEKRADELQVILDAHPALEWLQLPWAGVDAFSAVLAGLAAQPEKSRLVVTSAKGAYSEPVAEHALALLLACMRELPRKAREAHWQAKRTGISVFGRHIVILGAGGVAQTFIELVAPFRPRITVVRRGEGAVAGAHLTVGHPDLHRVLETADAVIVAAAATAGTRHMVGAAQLAVMPDHAVLVNIARGSLVDADAVLDSLQRGTLFGAGLDVMDPEPFSPEHGLWQEKRAVITSHSADTPEMTRPLLAARIRTNVEAFVSVTSLVGVVDASAGY